MPASCLQTVFAITHPDQSITPEGFNAITEMEMLPDLCVDSGGVNFDNESMIRFHNTYSGKIEPFEPIKPGKVKLYTCGPTVYDHQHIGNYRAYVFEDLLKKFLRFMGYSVIHVMNITDIDDKTIKGANERGVTLQEYTKDYIDSFFADLETLKIDKADHYPRATEFIQEMAQMVKGLHDKGFAYEKDGSYYFDISKFPNYGRLSKINTDALRTGSRVDSDEYEKEGANDFALWKARKENEPYWETEIGQGRPGWHIECSVMSSKYLGESFDIHCGGVDNIFPHHENEIAQSEALTGKPFVRYWMHCQHLIRDGEKMSKSLGNTTSIQELTTEHGADPMAIRYMLLTTHYRKILNFTKELLEQAHASLRRIQDFVYELESRTFVEGENPEVSDLIVGTKQAFAEGLSDDLNISTALTAFFDMIRKVNIWMTQDKICDKDVKPLLSCTRSINSVLGVLPEEREESLPDEILKKIEAREEARRQKDFALADRIREELLGLGLQLEDTKDGTRWKIIQRR
jgi:cysteinyl-tRNA synthetase